MEHRIAGFMLAAAIALAQNQPSFEVASIKPSNSSDTRALFNMQSRGRFSAANVTVRRLIQVAYGIKDFQLSGGPGWIGSDRFDIDATPGAGATDQLPLMLQSLLADRFKLITHKETKEMPVYALVVAKNGPKFKEANATDPLVIDLGRPGNSADGPNRPSVSRIRRGMLVAQETNMTTLANQLANFLGRNVVDKTGLTGKYDLKLAWTPDENQTAMFGAMGLPETTKDAPPPDPLGPSLFTALEEQLGLKLDSQKGPVEMLVIERIERPSEN